MGTPVDKWLVCHWEKRLHHGPEFNCDFWDCPHKVQDGDLYYVELFPDGHLHSYCLECAADYMAQILNLLPDKLVS